MPSEHATSGFADVKSNSKQVPHPFTRGSSARLVLTDPSQAVAQVASRPTSLQRMGSQSFKFKAYDHAVAAPTVASSSATVSQPSVSDSSPSTPAQFVFVAAPSSSAPSSSLSEVVVQISGEEDTSPPEPHHDVVLNTERFNPRANSAASEAAVPAKKLTFIASPQPPSSSFSSSSSASSSASSAISHSGPKFVFKPLSVTNEKRQHYATLPHNKYAC